MIMKHELDQMNKIEAERFKNLQLKKDIVRIMFETYMMRTTREHESQLIEAICDMTDAYNDYVD